MSIVTTGDCRTLRSSLLQLSRPARALQRGMDRLEGAQSSLLDVSASIREAPDDDEDASTLETPEDGEDAMTELDTLKAQLVSALPVLKQLADAEGEQFAEGEQGQDQRAFAEEENAGEDEGDQDNQAQEFSAGEEDESLDQASEEASEEEEEEEEKENEEQAEHEQAVQRGKLYFTSELQGELRKEQDDLLADGLRRAGEMQFIKEQNDRETQLFDEEAMLQDLEKEVLLNEEAAIGNEEQNLKTMQGDLKRFKRKRKVLGKEQKEEMG